MDFDKYVSVIIPAYNAEKTIKKSIESVLNQTYPFFEIIVVNDCSTDKTAEIVIQLTELDSRIRLLSNTQNSGVSVSRNNGVRQAKFDWIALLDSDDYWEKEKLELQMKEVEAHPKAELFFTGAKYIDWDGKPYGYIFHVPETVEYKELLLQNVISCSSVLVRREEMIKNPMNQRRDIHEDFITWLQILKDGKAAIGIDKPLLVYRISANSKSGNKLKSAKMQNQAYKIIGLNLFHRIYYLVQYGVRGVRKYSSIRNSKEQEHL